MRIFNILELFEMLFYFALGGIYALMTIIERSVK